MKVSVIFSMYNFLVIWLWFKVENICDMSILMYNLPHCLLERLYSLASGIFFSFWKIHSVSFIEISALWVEDVFSRSFARPSFKWGVVWLALFLFVHATAKFYPKTCESLRSQDPKPNKRLPELALNTHGFIILHVNKQNCIKWWLSRLRLVDFWAPIAGYFCLSYCSWVNFRTQSKKDLLHHMRNGLISFTFQRHHL